MMLVSFGTNMIVIQKNASVRILIKLLSVNQNYLHSPIKQSHSGDIAVSENTFNKMIKNNYDSQPASYPSPKAYFWGQNFVNGQYLITYELDYALNQNVATILPKVYWNSVKIKPEINKGSSKINRYLDWSL